MCVGVSLKFRQATEDGQYVQYDTSKLSFAFGNGCQKAKKTGRGCVSPGSCMIYIFKIIELNISLDLKMCIV